MHLNRDVEGGQRGQQRRGAIASIPPRGEVSIEQTHGDGHHLPRQIEVIDDVEGPVADLFPPRRVQFGHAVVYGDRGGEGECVVVADVVGGAFGLAHGGEAVDDTAAGEVADNVPSYAEFVVLGVVGVGHGCFHIGCVFGGEAIEKQMIRISRAKDDDDFMARTKDLWRRKVQMKCFRQLCCRESGSSPFISPHHIKNLRIR